MTTKTFDFDARDIKVGLVLVVKGYGGGYYGASVLDYTWITVDGVETKYWAIQFGKVEGEKFVAEKGDVHFLPKKHFKSLGYDLEWTDGPEFNNGDFLVDQNGQVYFYQNADQLWKLGKGEYTDGAQYASLKHYRDNKKLTFKVFTTANGTPFRETAAEKS